MQLSSPMWIFQQDIDAEQSSVSPYSAYTTPPGDSIPLQDSALDSAELPLVLPAHFPTCWDTPHTSPTSWAYRPSCQMAVVWKFIEGAFHPTAQKNDSTLNKVSLTPSPAEFPCNWWASIFYPYCWSPEVQPIFTSFVVPVSPEHCRETEKVKPVFYLCFSLLCTFCTSIQEKNQSYPNKNHHQKKNRIVLLQTTCVRDLMESVERFLRIFLVCSF